MKVYQSPYPPVEKFDKRGVFSFIFEDNANWKDSDIALIDANTNVKTTYRQLVDTALSFADGLSRVAGLKKRDTVLIFAPNSTLYPALLFAGQALGVTVTTANSSYTTSELVHQIQVSDASVLLVGSDMLAVAREAAKETGINENKIYVLPSADGKVHPNGLQSFEKLKGSSNFKPVTFTEQELAENIAYLPFSSGTTGKGKGVALSARNVTGCAQQLNATKGFIDQRETVIGVLPLYHIFGLMASLHQTLLNGGTLVVLTPFDIIKFCDAIQRYKATITYVVPPMALGLVRHPGVPKYDLTSLRLFVSAAAPLSESLQIEVQARLPKTTVTQAYGMTETACVGMLPDLKNYKNGSCGALVSSMEARLVDPDGKDVEEGAPGELLLRGPNIMIGYFKNKKATDETIIEDGWMRTGDVCVRDSFGNYTIVDRTKELIKYKGFQVAPAELEGLLLTSPLVADCAVIGVWSEEQASELPRAYVVPASGHATDSDLEKKIVAFVRAKVAPHKRLRGGVRFIDIIPKSPSGKILRKDLRTLDAANTHSTSRL